MDVSVVLDILQILAGVFGFAGAALIVYGGLRAAMKVLFLEFGKRTYVYNQIRNEFTSKIVFGLEFLIAADILRTLIAPTQQEIINLGAVVVIRTILGYFLQREARDFSLE
jgi:uncharacterized membrane protein